MKWCKYFWVLLFSVAFNSLAHADDDPAPEIPAEDLAEKVTFPVDAHKEDQKELFHFTKHNESFAAWGVPDTKIQLSVKYQFVKDFGLYLGYTQFIFWKLLQKAKPFDDADYNPEIFYRLNLHNNFFESLDIVPEEHKSNGQGTLPTKRSYDSFGVRLNVHYDFGSYAFKWTTGAFRYYNFYLYNEDYRDYVGPFEMTFSLTHYMAAFVDRVQFSLRFFTGGTWGEKLSYGGQEALLSFRIGNSRFNPSLLLEAYNGQAESLLNYNQYQRQIRMGIQF